MTEQEAIKLFLDDECLLEIGWEFDLIEISTEKYVVGTIKFIQESPHNCLYVIRKSDMIYTDKIENLKIFTPENVGFIEIKNAKTRDIDYRFGNTKKDEFIEILNQGKAEDHMKYFLIKRDMVIDEEGSIRSGLDNFYYSKDLWLKSDYWRYSFQTAIKNVINENKPIEEV